VGLRLALVSAPTDFLVAARHWFCAPYCGTPHPTRRLRWPNSRPLPVRV